MPAFFQVPVAKRPQLRYRSGLGSLLLSDIEYTLLISKVDKTLITDDHLFHLNWILLTPLFQYGQTSYTY